MSASTRGVVGRAALGLTLVVVSGCGGGTRTQQAAGGPLTFPTASGGMLTLELFSPRMVRVRYRERGAPEFRPSLAVVATAPAGGVPHTVTRAGRETIVKTGALQVAIERRTGRVRFLAPDGAELLAEGARSLTPAAPPEDKAFEIRQDFRFAPDEALYGLGGHQDGVFNWRGRHAELFQMNQRDIVPVLVSTRGYGIVWDNPSYGRFNDDAHGSYLWSEVGDGVDYTFAYGPALDDVVAGYRALTGQAPMFGRWAFGYVQSKERYVSQDDVLNTVREYRKRQIPIDVIVQDWQYWPEGQWGQKSFDPTRFPDPKAMLDTLHDELNVHFMISLWPNAAARTPDHDEMKAQPGFLYTPDKGRSFYDAFNPAARKLYWEQAKRGLFDFGVDAWWCDATEPELLAWNTWTEAYREIMKPAIGSGARYMNAYSLMQAQGIYEGQRAATSDKRVLNLTRSAWLGQQRYAAFTWSGDTGATWDSLRTQITAGLNFSITGIPYWTHDIGAFFVRGNQTKIPPQVWFPHGVYPDGLASDEYKELYLRWFQFGAMTPMFRSHGTDVPREVWQFGAPGTPIYDALVKAIHLRYRLMPYIYSTAWRVTRDGYTMLRPMAMDFRDDPRVYGLGDQYMFGPALLVAPVLAYQADSRFVYLPKGSWYDFWTGWRHDGRQTLTMPGRQLDRFPLFVRGGAILPLAPVAQYAAGSSGTDLELRVYPGADGHAFIYEDENDSYNYEKGQHATIALSWDDRARVLTIGARQGSFPGMVERRKFSVVLVREGHGRGVAPEDRPEATVEYDGQELRVGPLVAAERPRAGGGLAGGAPGGGAAPAAGAAAQAAPEQAASPSTATPATPPKPAAKAGKK